MLPIFQKSCLDCRRAGQIAPSPLITATRSTRRCRSRRPAPRTPPKQL